MRAIDSGESAKWRERAKGRWKRSAPESTMTPEVTEVASAHRSPGSPQHARSSQPNSVISSRSSHRRSGYSSVNVRSRTTAFRNDIFRQGVSRQGTPRQEATHHDADESRATDSSLQHKKNWQSLKFSIKNNGIPPEYEVTRFPLPNPYELMWAALGVLITAAGAFLQVTVPDAWTVGVGPIQLAGYRFSFQLAGLLVTAFMGGARAALLSQLAYLGMGLAGFDIFMDGGGTAYIQRPAFGYLVGFIPGAWLCGRLAEMEHRTKPAHLFMAGLGGLLAVHVTGFFYLVLQPLPAQLWQTVLQYSGYTLLGQILVLAVCVALSWILRVAMLY